MTIRTTLITTGLIAASLVSGAAHAVLQGRDLNGSAGSFEAYYDTVLDITWLADANYAKTSGYTDALLPFMQNQAETGAMTWSQATTWAANLVYGGYSDWRLPTVSPLNGVAFNYNYSLVGAADEGFNISNVGTIYEYSTSSEMAYMFYINLGNPSYYTLDRANSNCQIGINACLNNAGPFNNLKSNTYWSDTVSALYSLNTPSSFFFSTANGIQQVTSQNTAGLAWAVRDGDVAAVPEADTWAMLLAGLGLVGVAARRRRGCDLPDFFGPLISGRRLPVGWLNKGIA